MDYNQWLKTESKKPWKPQTRDNDGVDYVRHVFISEKGAPLADYEPTDGSIKINMDELWESVKDDTYEFAEETVRVLYMEVLSHEMKHKWFVWGMEAEWDGTFNEMDERVMRVMSDWTQFGKMTKMEEYDWK